MKEDFNSARLWNVGTFFGFNVKIQSDNYIELVKAHEDFGVAVIYDYTQRFFVENVIYMNLEYNKCIFDLQVMKEFNETVTQAIMIMEKLKEFENEE